MDFRSSNGRTSIGEDASSWKRQHHRRSRSLSRHDAGELSTPRGKFVNKVRGSGIPEMSLDDLADEFFRARAESDEESEASARRTSSASYLMDTEASRRRGRSASRPPVSGGFESGTRRGSLSAARKPFGAYENDVDGRAFGSGSKSRASSSGKFQQSSSRKALHSSGGLRRSFSQRNIALSSDSFSSHSSLTDDEARDSQSGKCGIEKTIQTVYASEKADVPMGDDDNIGLYEAMRKEVRCAVEEIKTELEKVMVKTEHIAVVDDVKPQSADVLEAITEIKRNYATKLEQSEKRRQGLLAQLAVEEECGQDLSKILKELLPSPKKCASSEKQTRPRRRSNDRTRISKRLTEEAEKYFEDFLSNVEDTDISSFDGERSDTGSSIRERELHSPLTSSNECLLKVAPLPHVVDGVDGVLFPWLEWETSSELSPKHSLEIECWTPGNKSTAAAQKVSIGFRKTVGEASSTDSCSPIQHGSSSIPEEENESKCGLACDATSSSTSKACAATSSSTSKAKVFSFDMEEYLSLQRSEDLLFEMLKQRHRIDSGCMILCGRP